MDAYEMTLGVSLRSEWPCKSPGFPTSSTLVSARLTKTSGNNFSFYFVIFLSDLIGRLFRSHSFDLIQTIFKG